MGCACYVARKGTLARISKYERNRGCTHHASVEHTDGSSDARDEKYVDAGYCNIMILMITSF
jgi:hypothetical protein